MTLEFPNRSRSFDPVRNAVRFTGYDGMFEVPIFVEAAVLDKQGSVASTEADFLNAFDASRGAILDVAREAYSHGRLSSYTLTEDDFC